MLLLNEKYSFISMLCEYLVFERVLYINMLCISFIYQSVVHHCTRVV